jgi:hypothetical protein
MPENDCSAFACFHYRDKWLYLPVTVEIVVVTKIAGAEVEEFGCSR